MNRSPLISAGLTLFVLAASLPLAAQAQTARVKCEVRSDRSTASVDGRNVTPGQYVAVLSSGSHTATSPVQASVGDQAEFDFSSQPRDIRRGATPIAVDFIVGDTVTGQVFTAAGQLVAQSTRRCRVR